MDQIAFGTGIRQVRHVVLGCSLTGTIRIGWLSRADFFQRQFAICVFVDIALRLPGENSRQRRVLRLSLGDVVVLSRTRATPISRSGARTSAISSEAARCTSDPGIGA